MSLHPFRLRIAALFTLIATPAMAFAQAAAGGDGGAGITLLEPINGVRTIPVNGGGLGVFGFYFDLIYPWIVGMSAGIAVLMAVVGGIQIIQAGSDQGKVSAGKNRLLLSLGGLLIILFSATILNALNPTFFK